MMRARVLVYAWNAANKRRPRWQVGPMGFGR